MRALKWLAVLILILGTGGWFAAKMVIEKAAADWFADRSAAGMTATNSGVSVGGFPTEMRVGVADLVLADPVSGAGWQTPMVEVVAATWAPWHLTAKVADEQVITLPDQQIAVRAEALVATLGASPAVTLPLQEATLRAAMAELQSDLGWSIGLSDPSVALTADTSRPAGAYLLDYDLAPLRPDPAFAAALQAVVLPDLPTPDFPAEIEQLNGKIGLRFDGPLAANAAGARPKLQVIEVMSANFAWGNLGFHAEGLLEADADGYAAGRIMLELTNWDRLPALLVATGVIKPAFAPTIGGALKALAAQSPDPAVVTLALDMKDGRMSLGPFPLGKALRLRRPEG